MTDIATHLSSSCLCPNRTSLLFYLIRFRGPARVGSLRVFKAAPVLISQASEEPKNNPVKICNAKLIAHASVKQLHCQDQGEISTDLGRSESIRTLHFPLLSFPTPILPKPLRICNENIYPCPFFVFPLELCSASSHREENPLSNCLYTTGNAHGRGGVEVQMALRWSRAQVAPAVPDASS